MGLSRMFFEIKVRQVRQSGDFIYCSGFIAMKAKDKRQDAGKSDFLSCNLSIYKKTDVNFNIVEGDTVFGWTSNFYLETYTSKKTGEIKPLLDIKVWSPYEVRIKSSETKSGYAEANNDGVYDNGYNETDMNGMGSGDYTVDSYNVPF